MVLIFSRARILVWKHAIRDAIPTRFIEIRTHSRGDERKYKKKDQIWYPSCVMEKPRCALLYVCKESRRVRISAIRSEKSVIV